MKTYIRSILPILLLAVTGLFLSGCGEGAGNPGLNDPQPGDSSEVTIFYDGFEDGLDNWMLDFTWGRSTASHSGLYSLYTQDFTGLSGTAQIDLDFDLSDCSTAALSFWSRTDFSEMPLGQADTRVMVEANDDSLLVLWVDLFYSNQLWTRVNLSLDGFCGWASKFEIAFWYTKYQPGVITWWIDDVELTSD